jgi:SOS-response transcriptional repressor LexA
MTGDHEIGGRQVPVLRDAAAAGTPRAIDEGEIEYTLTFPPSLLPRGGKLFGVKIEGDSMSPFLETGYVVLIDVASRSPERLAGRMVAAREGDGLTIKWLRKQGDGVYLLVPQNTSLRHQIHIMHADGDWSIVGEVVKWIGEPPPPPKRK